MAYAGGYAGGYADTLVPPDPPVVTYGGGDYRPTELSKHAKSILRWRLAIIGTGAIAAIEPLDIKLTLTGQSARAHADGLIDLHYRPEQGGTGHLATRSIYHLQPDGTPAIIDPDEWLIFLP